MASVLEQFEIKTIAPFTVGGADLAFTNSALAMVVVTAFAAVFFLLALAPARLVPGRLQVLAETGLQSIGNMVEATAGPKARPFVPLMLTIFFFIFFGNVFGLIPGVFTFTSHIVVTFALAAIIFLAVVVTGFIKHGTHFLSLFVPKGVPVVLVPVMFVLELVSFCVRPFSLSVRLCANMMAGHILLKVFAGMVASLLIALGVTGGLIGILPLGMTIFVIAFEFFVAGLQAYIFAILGAVYLRDALELH